ncbi:hypothetical protein CEF21_06685 [Bacillus sp. FJAT-42376]|uniref:DUF5365 family protein n=1 Tax=Bacillus sp. FJAT-42376 TaxID=2014076 RepID=UPI000F4F1CF3|nr:DUF5365 family protein [Bacillus sp. FJAT-42376]AZB42004.1 hypothetical protein CEF21_06685 [Bacillus sp. FJAT-42376]
MKIVTASTNEQEQHIEELVEEMYKEVFPIYFSDETIGQLEKMAVLKPTDETMIYNGTLKEAFEIMSSLQTLIAVLKHADEGRKQEYESLYERNREILGRYGYELPLTFSDFLTEGGKGPLLSRYTKAANRYLI